MAHARNAPSDSKRWLLCSGSLRRCKELGLDNSAGSPAAREGTAAHWVRETCLEFGFEPFDLIGTKIAVEGETFECDGDMADALLPGLDRCRQFLGKVFVELRVDTTPWVGLDEAGNRQGGTLDFGCVCEEVIVISDLKYGRNIPVEAIRNYQQILYALAFYHQVAKHLTKATKFLIIIDQPRNSAGGGEWEVDLEELEAIGEWIKERAVLTFDPNAPCTPSKEACLWCPASNQFGACPEYEAWQIAMLETDIEDLDDFQEFGMELTPPETSALTPQRLSVIFQHRSILRKFLERVERHVTSAVRSGDGAAFGLKAVAGKRSKRVHADADKSEEWLVENGFELDQIINKQLKTPAQLDKVCGRGKFPLDLILGGEPTPTIVPIEDARLALPAETLTDEEVEELDDFD